MPLSRLERVVKKGGLLSGTPGARTLTTLLGNALFRPPLLFVLLLIYHSAFTMELTLA